jgi:RNA polymerase sigma-70 factor, ECF subfamily
VVVLFYLEDRPMEEVADLVGCSTSIGFVHPHRARHRLAHPADTRPTW